jgi:hypothetical protein
MSLDINISVNEELSALLRGSLSAATSRRVAAWAIQQLAKKKLGLPYERLPGFYSPSQPFVQDTLVIDTYNGGEIAQTWSPIQREEKKEKPGARRVRLDVSVIDEDDNYSGDQQADWQRYRSANPYSQFMLLVPTYNSSQISSVNSPSVIANDPAAKIASVGRPGDPFQKTSGPAWKTLLPSSINSGNQVIDSVNIFVDTSGSMDLATVEPDLNAFKGDIASLYGVTPNVISSSAENWLLPHIG